MRCLVSAEASPVIAARQALGKASSWLDHQFSLIAPVTLPAAMHVALDDVIAQSVAKGLRGPNLKSFWDWDDSVV